MDITKENNLSKNIKNLDVGNFKENFAINQETKNNYEYNDINSLAKIKNEKLQNYKEKSFDRFKENTIFNTISKTLVNNYELTKNIGLMNIGHTCYMNSFLQILLHTPTLKKKKKKKYKNNIGEETIINNLIKLSENPYDSHYLYEIKKIISKTYPQYGDFVQNDTQIFAIDFLDSIIGEIKNEKSYVSDNLEENEIIIHSEKENKSVKLAKFNKFKLNYKNLGEQTFIEDLFLLSDSKINYKGKLIDPKKIKFDILLNIELNFPVENIKEIYTLDELIDFKYTNSSNDISQTNQNEIIDSSNEIKNNTFNSQFYEKIQNLFSYLFGCCFKKNEINKDLIKKIEKEIEPESLINNNFEEKELSKITSLPKILIISINRGIHGKNLISSFIKFYDKLDLRNYIDQDLYNGKLGTSFRLFAINLREGCTKSSGHCYSFVKVENDWICYNDSEANKQIPSYSLNSVVGLYYFKDDLKHKNI